MSEITDNTENVKWMQRWKQRDVNVDLDRHGERKVYSTIGKSAVRGREGMIYRALDGVERVDGKWNQCHDSDPRSMR